jgi:cobaltochelatase CobN
VADHLWLGLLALALLLGLGMWRGRGPHVAKGA